MKFFQRRKRQEVIENKEKENVPNNGLAVKGNSSICRMEARKSSKTARQFQYFFDTVNKTSSAHNLSNSYTDNQWIPPESWSKPEVEKKAAPSLKSSLNQPLLDQKVWHFRVFKPTESKSFVSLADDHLSNVGIYRYSITASDLLKHLAKKYFVEDVSRYNLFLIRCGKEFPLHSEDKPIEMLVKLLQNIGYSMNDQIEKIGFEDHSYYFRFVFREVNSFQKQIEEIPSNFKDIDLQDQNLSLLPVALFKCNRFIETLNLSRNLMLSYPMDFYSECPELREIVLNENELDFFPPAIGQVASLKTLKMAQNNLTTNSFKHITTLENLTSLNLECNLIEHYPNELSLLVSLRFLNLSNNNLVELSPRIGDNVNLRTLNLGFNRLTCLPDEICDLPHLKRLILVANQINYLPEYLNEIETLEYLDIRSNYVNDISMLNNCVRLTQLLADYNELYCIKDEVRMPSLSKFSLKHALVANYSWKTSAICIRELDLTYCRLSTFSSENVFENCMSLEKLDLGHNQLVSLPKSLSLCTRLVHFSAPYNRLSEIPPLQSGLQFLDLHCNRIHEIPKHIWALKHLWYLNLSSNVISAFPKLIAYDLQNCLKELYLAENRISSGVSLEQISSLYSLEVLYLGYNGITELPASIWNLDKLRELSVSGNQLSFLPDEFDKLRNLNVLYLDSNKFTTLPAAFSRMNLKVLDASWNSLKYNITNFTFDWNWNWNTELVSLDLSGNHKLEIKEVAGTANPAQVYLADFSALTKLRILDISDIKVLPNPVPNESVDCRVRYGCHDIEPLIHGISQSLDRDHMDCHVWDMICHRFNGSENNHLWGLFSGRNGSRFAKYLYDSFSFNFGASLNKDSSIPDILRRTFLYLGREYGYADPNERSGASAVVCFMNTNMLYTANVGDSMAVLCRGGEAMLLSQKHFAWNRSEFARIRELNGYFDGEGNVQGESNVTRAFGHFHLLPYVNATPDVSSTEIQESDEFIILGCEGFWKVMSYQTAVDIARMEKHQLPQAAKKLRAMALSYGARSSITVAVVSAHPNFEGFKSPRRRPYELVPERIQKEISPPTGLLALVFTDIKNSTGLWENHPTEMQEAIEIHNTVMRRSLRIFGGYEVRTEGDAFMVAFRSVSAALLWCLDVQLKLLEADWPLKLLESETCKVVYDDEGSVLYRGLSVRMGIHYGAPVYKPDEITKRMDYHGVMVIRASRINGCADGGQIMVSRLVYEIYNEKMEDEDTFDLEPCFYEVGETFLKGLINPDHLFAVYPRSLAKRHVGKSKESPSMELPLCDSEHISEAHVKVLYSLCNRLKRLIKAPYLIERWIPDILIDDESADVAELFKELVINAERYIAILQLTKHTSESVIESIVESSIAEDPFQLLLALNRYCNDKHGYK